MKRRYSIYLVVIALLAAINLGRWWLHAAKEQGASVARSKVFLPEDFRLRAEASATADEPHRDLFQPAGKAAIRTTLSQTRQSAAKKVGQAPVQHEPTEAEAAGAELSKLKLLGVVFRAGKGQAYLARDKENIIALVGDTVLSRFVVEKVSIDAVDLRDLKTNISRRIPVSGK